MKLEWPNSGAVVPPTKIPPAFSTIETIKASSSGTQSRYRRELKVVRLLLVGVRPLTATGVSCRGLSGRLDMTAPSAFRAACAASSQ